MLTIDKYEISIQKANTSKLKEVIPSDLTFGADYSDHMFTSDFRDGEWIRNRIEPFGDISLSPANCVLHYGQAIFEGMKVYKGKDGKIRFFRLYDNAKRFNISAERMCMPAIPEDLFATALKELINLDQDWVPNLEGCSLYVRPFMIADEVFLGVKPASKYKFMIICSPASSYYKEPVRVKIENKYSRAARGGVGYAKAAGNYAAAMYPSNLANKDGFHQLVWTDAVEHKYVEESGTMNLMFVIDNKLVTPSLESETILPGITRDSVIKISKDLGYDVEERQISVDELIQAHHNGLMQDAFGLGTAANIAPIESIGYDDGEILLPPIEDRHISNKISKTISGIKYGEIADTYGWIEEL